MVSHLGEEIVMSIYLISLKNIFLSELQSHCIINTVLCQITESKIIHTPVKNVSFNVHFSCFSMMVKHGSAELYDTESPRVTRFLEFTVLR